MRLIAHDALTAARRILGGVQTADTLARAGHHEQSRALLSQLASEAMAELPVIDGVLAAQTEAAKGLDRAQWTPSGCIPLRERPEPHLTAANDEHGISPEQPASPVA